MRELVCIVCPRGCTMQIQEQDGTYRVSGNTCKRGEQFAISEMTRPMRTICTTVRTTFPDVPVISVRVSAEIPKDRIFDVMGEIRKVRLDKPLRRGEAVIRDVLGLGVDILVTSDLLEERKDGTASGSGL
ncbi:MAG: DUF1667 domain-containing protein [Faecousia sp.]